MNWKEIKKTCPKALKEALDATEYHEIMEPRDLYDHFDALGIICSVETFTRNKVAWFEGRVKLVPDRGKHFRSTRVSTRTEAESAAFTRAFALREAQITKDNE